MEFSTFALDIYSQYSLNYNFLDILNFYSIVFISFIVFSKITLLFSYNIHPILMLLGAMNIIIYSFAHE